MPLYHFNLHDGYGVRSDRDGIQLPDAAAAKDYAVDVINELMRNREPRTRYWKLDVCDAAGEVLFAIDFSSVDRTLDHLEPQLRQSIDRMGENLRSLTETIWECRMTILQSRALIARADRKPYVAAHNGRRIEV